MWPPVVLPVARPPLAAPGSAKLLCLARGQTIKPGCQLLKTRCTLLLLKCLAAFCVLGRVGAAPSDPFAAPDPSPTTCGCSAQLEAMEARNSAELEAPCCAA